jgi:hypothetical protein
VHKVGNLKEQRDWALKRFDLDNCSKFRINFLTISNPKSENHGSKTMETLQYPGATAGVRSYLQVCYFTRAPTRHILHLSLNEPPRQYCKALLSFSFSITKPGALSLMKKTFGVLYTGRVGWEGGWDGVLGVGCWVMRERKGDDCCWRGSCNELLPKLPLK